jgi:type IV secretory pathway TrbD component
VAVTHKPPTRREGVRRLRNLAWVSWLPVVAGAFIALYVSVWFGLALWAVGVALQVVAYAGARREPFFGFPSSRD